LAAAFNQRPNIVQVLLESQGVLTDIVDNDDQTPLCNAVLRRPFNPPILKLLLEASSTDELPELLEVAEDVDNEELVAMLREAVKRTESAEEANANPEVIVGEEDETITSI
jgi:hypothetical protein